MTAAGYYTRVLERALKGSPSETTAVMLLHLVSSFRLVWPKKRRGANNNRTEKSEGAREKRRKVRLKRVSPCLGDPSSAHCLLSSTSAGVSRFSRHSCNSYSHTRVLLWAPVILPGLVSFGSSRWSRKPSRSRHFVALPYLSADSTASPWYPMRDRVTMDHSVCEIK